MSRTLLVIAVIKEFVQDGKKPKTVGYRIFDTVKGSVVDYHVTDKNGIGFCMQNANNFLNVAPMADKILDFKFTNGQESRYPVINSANGQLVGTNPLVIVKEYNDGYRIVDAFGHTFDWTDDVTLQYAAMQGIANGKQVTLGGKVHISSISGQYPKEDITLAQKKTEKAAVKGTPVKAGVFPETFYKSLEPGFGGKHSVDILRHLFENRGLAKDRFLNVLKAMKDQKEAPQVPAMIGLMVQGDDMKASKNNSITDRELLKLLSVVVEKEGLVLIASMTKDYGVYFDELWATPIMTPVRQTKAGANIRITESYVAAKIANYAMASGKTIKDCSVNEDASEIIYCGKEVKNDTYMISGIYDGYITMTNAINKTVKLKAAVSEAK